MGRDKVLVQHMLDFALRAEELVAGVSRTEYEKDVKLQLALERCIEVIGEAANGVSRDLQDSNPEIPWRQIGGMRNRIVHEYWEVDTDTLWRTVEEETPKLSAELKKILTALE